MKKLVFQVDVPGPEGHTLLSHNTPIYTISKSKAKKYATKCGADYLCVNNDKYVPGWAAHFQKFSITNKYFDKYDMILWVDSDLIIYEHTPNIFEFAESRSEIFFAVIEDHMTRMNLLANYFNSGYMLFKREMINQLTNWEEVYNINRYYKSKLGEQHAFNKIVYDYHPEYFKLSRHFNSNGQVTRYFGIHFTGIGKRQFTPEKVNKWEEKAKIIYEKMDDREKADVYFEWRPVVSIDKIRKKLF